MGVMKGDGLSWMVSVPLLVYVGMFVIAMIGGFYIRTLVAGPPVQVTTYTEYRWMNYLPSSAFFALTYSPTAEDSPSWNALNEIALYDAPITPILVKRSEISDYFSKIDGLSELDYATLDSRLKVIEESFNEGSIVQREFNLVKDSGGVVLAYGMDNLLSDVKEGKSAMITFPEDYPYKCSQTEMPVFSGKEGRENLRVKMVVCCQGIKTCADYISQAGSGQCESDYCGVGPCRIIHPVEKERQCTENSPPIVEFEVALNNGKDNWQAEDAALPYAKGALMEVKYKVTVKEDSAIKGISIDWKDGPVDQVALKDLVISPGADESSVADVKTYTVSKTHLYKSAGSYTVTCKVWDERDNPVEREIKIKITQG